MAERKTSGRYTTYLYAQPTPDRAAGRTDELLGLGACWSRRCSGISSGQTCRLWPVSSSPCSPERSASAWWSTPHGTEDTNPPSASHQTFKLCGDQLLIWFLLQSSRMTDNVGEKTFSHNEWSSSENTMICVSKPNILEMLE